MSLETQEQPTTDEKIHFTEAEVLQRIRLEKVNRMESLMLCAGLSMAFLNGVLIGVGAHRINNNLVDVSSVCQTVATKLEPEKYIDKEVVETLCADIIEEEGNK